MKAARNHNDVTRKLTHISGIVQRLEQLVQSDRVDWQGTGIATLAYWRARIEANAELQPQARLATLEARSQRRSSAQGGN
ncbi:hypothetical protein [Paraburkholderia sp. MM6662-R1]|uniref:hypothetical protein n=1 Tax=Paraburkholderia sp. MM6662-R1 TaxID=2991066 RepID=UPI003D25150D